MSSIAGHQIGVRLWCNKKGGQRVVLCQAINIKSQQLCGATKRVGEMTRTAALGSLAMNILLRSACRYQYRSAK
jgi:hypothetical protein